MKKSDLEIRISALLDRDSGTSYPEVLETHDLSPGQFSVAVTKYLTQLIQSASDSEEQVLLEIDSDERRKAELFRMGEGFIGDQYRRIIGDIAGESQRSFYLGTFAHPENAEFVAFTALAHHNPKLSSENRSEVVQELRNLPVDLGSYFDTISLMGLMSNVFEDSPLSVLKAFDRVYQRKTGNKSVFDLRLRHHVHEWEVGGAPRNYWQDANNRERAAYHLLIEKHPELSSRDREEVVEVINSLPSNLQVYLHSIGLSGVMHYGFKGSESNSPLALLKFFDRIYQKKTGNGSLFDLRHEHHVHEWEVAGHTSNYYWQDSRNVERVVYHTLIEHNPNLAAKNREKVVEGIKSLPSDLHDYLQGIGLSALLSNALSEGDYQSPLTVLKVFDRVYQRKTGDVSLFDLEQEVHLHEWEVGGSAPNSYWQDSSNVERAVHHILTENYLKLASEDRETVIQTVKSLPTNLVDYLNEIGLSGIMRHAFGEKERGSPLPILKAFDRVYQQRTGDASLFDLDQKHRLEFGLGNRLVR